MAIDPTEGPKVEPLDQVGDGGTMKSRRGPLLQQIEKESDERKVAKLAVRMWESQDEMMKPLEEQWMVNELRRKGVPNVRLKGNKEEGVKHWFPPNVAPGSVSQVNKAAGMCRKFAALLFTDPPAPDPLPDRRSEDAEASAIFTRRVLENIQGPDELNSAVENHQCFDKGGNYGSGFRRFWVDETKVEPVKVYAGFDPGTGLKAEHMDEAVEMAPGYDWPEYKQMYAAPDGSLVEDVDEAAVRAVRTIRSEQLTGRNVRMIPHDSTWVGSASIVMVACFKSYGELRRMWPKKLDKLDDAKKKKLFAYEPSDNNYLMTAEQRKLFDDTPDNEDDRPVFCLTVYCKEMPEYAGGLELVTLGGEMIVERRDRKEPSGEVMPIPVTQFKQFTDGETHPYGTAMMDIVGAGNEVRQHQIANLMTHVERTLRRRTFIPSNSNLQQSHLNLPWNVPIRITQGGEPRYEQIPDYPRDGLKLFEITTNEMEEAGGLGQVASGLESPQVQSGKHAQAIVAQAHAAFAAPRLHVQAGYIRECDIELSLIRTYFDTPQRMDWVGEDGAYRERDWSGSDIGVNKVQIKPGSNTMLTPVAKLQYAQHLQSIGLLNQEELKDAMRGNVGGILGTEDDPYYMRVKRQIAAWKNGPPPGWEPLISETPDPVTGEPGPPFEQQSDQHIGGLFNPLSGDDGRFVAMMRYRELTKAQASTVYASFPPGWQWALDSEIQRAQAAASGATGEAQEPGQPAPQGQGPAQQGQGDLAPPKTPVPTEGLSLSA